MELMSCLRALLGRRAHPGPVRASKTGSRAAQLLSLLAQGLGPGHAQRGKQVKGRKGRKRTGPEQDGSGSWIRGCPIVSNEGQSEKVMCEKRDPTNPQDLKPFWTSP